MRSFKPETTIFNAAAAASTGLIMSVADFQKVVMKLGTASSANFTLKFQGSASDSAPDFSAAATVSNHWTYLAFVDYISGTVTAGGTGITSAGTDVFVTALINTSGLKWVTATITARSAGTITLTCVPFDNQ